MMFRQGESSKPVDEQWHLEREKARRTAFSTAEFSPQEITRWDLDTAQIDGSDNPRTFQYDPAIDILGTAKVDVRELDNR